MIDIKYICYDFIKCRGNLKKFIYNRISTLDFMGYIALSKNDFMICDANNKYELKSFSNSIYNEVMTEYDFNLIGENDNILDIGANVGFFALNAAKRTKGKVFAVEPVFSTELERNININKSNIKILKYALSNEPNIKIEFGGKSNTVQGKRLSEILKMCGHIDFLKCDCEGGEYCITKEELINSKIRTIEMELHYKTIDQKNNFIKMLTDAYYNIEIKPRSKNTCLIFANKLK